MGGVEGAGACMWAHLRAGMGWGGAGWGGVRGVGWGEVGPPLLVGGRACGKLGVRVGGQKAHRWSLAYPCPSHRSVKLSSNPQRPRMVRVTRTWEALRCT